MGRIRQMVVMMAIIGAILAQPARPAGKDTTMGPCAVTLNLQRARDPFREWSAAAVGNGGEPVTMVPSLDLKSSGYVALEGLSHASVQGAPMIGKAPDGVALAVDSAFFSPLQRVDATGPAAGADVPMGSVKPALLRKCKPRDIALFLVESRIIITYRHMESTVCLSDEQTGKKTYRAHFTGSHVYFTNERVEEPLDFIVGIDLKSGLITVNGG